MEAAIAEARVVYCEEEDCGDLVKPDIVFFGESVSSLARTPIYAKSSSMHLARLKLFTDTLTVPVRSHVFINPLPLAVCSSYRNSLGPPLHL
jgi:NAD-dependent SIR2 family protein deacetylase